MNSLAMSSLVVCYLATIGCFYGIFLSNRLQIWVQQTSGSIAVAQAFVGGRLHPLLYRLAPSACFGPEYHDKGRAAGRVLLRKHRGGLTQALGPQQFAIGTATGTELFGHSVWALPEADPELVVLGRLASSPSSPR